MSILVLVAGIYHIENSFASQSDSLIAQWGEFGIDEPGHFSHPQFAAIGNEGYVYVTDFGNKRVQKLTSTGEYILEWGKSGKQAGEFHYPSGIAVSNNVVFVVDRDLHRVQKFTTDGEFITLWGGKGKSNEQLLFPNGIAVYNQTVYVVDTGNQRIQVFSLDGDYISSFGSSGLGDGQFLTAVGIDIDMSGNIYISDRGNKNIQKFNSTGNYITSFGFNTYNYDFIPEAIAVDPFDSIYVLNSGNNKILHFAQNTTSLSVFEKFGPYIDSFNSVTDITIGINGELLVIDSENHKIKSFKTPFYTKPTIIDVPILRNSTSIDKNVTHTDTTPPIVIVPNSIIAEATDARTNVTIGTASATDDSGITAIINNAPETFPIGTTHVIWIAFNGVGLSADAMQNVTVNTCYRHPSEFNVIRGTVGDDLIIGTDGDDLIFGLDGNDLISGGNGDDCIFAGNGVDIVSGGNGTDTIRGNGGNDVLRGEAGADVLYGNLGSDILDGGPDSDQCYIQQDTESLQLSCND